MNASNWFTSFTLSTDLTYRVLDPFQGPLVHVAHAPQATSLSRHWDRQESARHQRKALARIPSADCPVRANAIVRSRRRQTKSERSFVAEGIAGNHGADEQKESAAGLRGMMPTPPAPLAVPSGSA